MASDEKRILLVEDEKVIRDAVAAYLERENYIVRGVGDGQSAVEEFEKHSFDLIILDLMLPKLSGERVCRAIRETSNVPIIMLTAKGDDMDKILGLEYGADDYMTKPFNILEVKTRIKTNFRRTAPNAELAEAIIETSCVRIRPLTSSPSSRIFPSSRSTSVRVSISASASFSSAAKPSRNIFKAMARYMAPVST